MSLENILGDPDPLKSTILIVDDSQLNLDIVTNFLNGAGFNNLYQAKDGFQALEMVEKIRPDLLILDIIMPELDGYEVIKVLRKKEEFYQTLPIIVQTALSDPQEQVQAWRSGANDIILKPINRMELLNRVHNLLKQQIILKNLKQYKNLLSEDLNYALNLQKSLLPSKKYLESVSHNTGIEINSLFVPARFLSGDLWGVIDFHKPYQVGVWMCDFSGKGIKAALETFRLHALLHRMPMKILQSPKSVLQELNSNLCELLEVQNFATFLYFIVDLKAKKLTYSSASAPSPLIFNNSSFQILGSEGLPLGIDSNFVYEDKQVHFGTSDKLILYSDQFWEEETPKEFLFTEENMPYVYEKHHESSLVDCYKKKFMDHICADDLTLIEIRQN